MATKKRPSLPPLPDLSHLTEDERKIIESVILRQRQEEEKEQEILKKLQDEFETYQKSVKKTDSSIEEDHFVSLTVNNNSKSPTNLNKNKDKEGVCGVCKKTLEGDVSKCHYCNTFLCNQCRTNLQLKNKDGWVCVICRKKQDILVKTGQWYHGGMAKPIDFEVDTNKPIIDEMLTTTQNMTAISPDHTADQTTCQTAYDASFQNNSYHSVQTSSIPQNEMRSQTIPNIIQDKKDIIDETTLNIAQPLSDAFLTQQNPLNNSSPYKQQCYAMSAQQQFPPRAPMEVQYPKHLYQHPDRLMQQHQLDTLSIDKSPKNNAKFPQDHKIDQIKRLSSENLKSSFRNAQEHMYNNQDFSNRQRRNILRDDSMGSDKSGESSSSPFTLFLPPQKDTLNKHSTHKHTTPNSGVLGSSVSSSEEDGLTNSHSVVSEGAEGWSGVPKSGSMRSLPPTLGKKEQSVLWQLCENGSKLVGHMVLKKTPEEGRPDKKTLGLKVTGGRQSGTHTGAFITRVKKGSVADVVARLQSGDEVISWNRRPLRNLTFDDVYDIIFASQQDSQVELVVERVLELDENRGFERRHEPMRGYGEHRRAATPSGRYFASEPMASPKAVSRRASSGYGAGGAYITGNSPYTDDYRYHYGGGYMGDYRYNYPPNHGMYMADYGMRRIKPRLSVGPLSDSPVSFHPSPCGRIHIKTAYLDAPSWQLNVTIVAASNLPPRPHNLLRNPYCKLYLLPDRSEKTKRRTKTVAGSLNPKWCQLFIYRPVRKKHLLSLALQITVYDYDRVGSGEYVGEAIVDLATCNLHDRLQSYPLHNDPFLEDQVKEHLSPPSSIISRFSDSEFSEIDASVTPTTSTTPTSMTKATTVTTSKQRNSKYKPPLMSTILHSSNDTLLDAATTNTGIASRDNDIIEESIEDHTKLEDNIQEVQEIEEEIVPERNPVRHRSRSSLGKNENGNKQQQYRHRSHERYLQTQQSQDAFVQKPRGRMSRGVSSDEYMEGRSERIDKWKEKKKINLSRDVDKNRKKIGMWEGEEGLLSDQSEMSIASHLSENVLSASKKSSRREGRDSLSTTFEVGSLSDTGMPDPPPLLNPAQRSTGTRHKLPPSIGHKMAALVGLSKKKSHSATQIGEVSKRGKASFQRSEEVGGMPPQWQSSKDSGDSCFTALEAFSASSAANDGGELSSFIEGLGPGQLVGRQALGSACLGQIQLGLNGKKGFLEVEVIRARGLVPKTTTRLLPAPYIKVYLMDGKVCVEKLKTAIARRTLDPLYQKTLTFREPYEGRLLQVTIWGDYGRLERKIFMGVVQIKLDDVPLNDLVIGWYKLFAHSSIYSTASNSASGGSATGTNKQLMVKQTSVSSQESAYASGSGGRS